MRTTPTAFAFTSMIPHDLKSYRAPRKRRRYLLAIGLVLALAYLEGIS